MSGRKSSAPLAVSADITESQRSKMIAQRIQEMDDNVRVYCEEMAEAAETAVAQKEADAAAMMGSLPAEVKSMAYADFVRLCGSGDPEMLQVLQQINTVLPLAPPVSWPAKVYGAAAAAGRVLPEPAGRGPGGGGALAGELQPLGLSSRGNETRATAWPDGDAQGAAKGAATSPGGLPEVQKQPTQSRRRAIAKRAAAGGK